MIKLIKEGIFLSSNGEKVEYPIELNDSLRKNTMAYQILKAHNKSKDMDNLEIKFDTIVSPDNNYVSILQTVIASGLNKFPVPYVLSNCHNTLCAVGGTINEDDHVFGMDCAKKYGGIFVPPYKAVIHEYMREMMAGCGKMILGSDSHTRYGALGTLAIGEGGGEIAKQLLSQTYNIKRPEVIAVLLKGKVKRGIGPHDVALALIGATFKNKFTKNKILEFIGDGIKDLSVEFRMGIDVMTTESGALSSIWSVDDKVRDYLNIYGREKDYKKIKPLDDCYYDGLIEIDLSKVESMIALPYHPGNVCTIHEFQNNPKKYLDIIEIEGQNIKGKSLSDFNIENDLKDGKFTINQGLVSGCSGGSFENISAVADILRGHVIRGDKTSLGINPASQPIFFELNRNGIINDLISSGVTIRPCICGPCFGVTDVPANNQISIRHVTRNYPNREGSKPRKDQMAATILMDARSIAATIRNNGVITAATDLDIEYKIYNYKYDKDYYEKQVFNNYNNGDISVFVRKGPNIEDWPNFKKISKHMLLKVAGVYNGSVTTDDLSPSGEAVAYRSNPFKLAEFTMINRDKDYIKRTKKIREVELLKEENNKVEDSEFDNVLSEIYFDLGCLKKDITIGSVIVSNEIGDGSSREQAASSQKILGGYANISNSFATKRYCSNLINWGILPITVSDISEIEVGDYIFIENIFDVIRNSKKTFQLKIIGKNKSITATIGELTKEEKKVLSCGGLINYNKSYLRKNKNFL